jgi:hypothetical protein
MFRLVRVASRVSAVPYNVSSLSAAGRTSLREVALPSDGLRYSQRGLRIIQARYASAATTAQDLSQQAVDEELSEYEDGVAQQRNKQHKRPWHREGTDQPPINRLRSAGAMTKGLPLQHIH